MPKMLGCCHYIYCALAYFTSYYPASMHESKVISHLSSLPRKSPNLDIQASEQLINVTNLSKSAKTWLECASNCLAWSMSVTNSIFLLAIVAMPIDRAHQHCVHQHQSPYVPSAHAHNLPGIYQSALVQAVIDWKAKLLDSTRCWCTLWVSIMSIIAYILSSRSTLRHIKWPTRLLQSHRPILNFSM